MATTILQGFYQSAMGGFAHYVERELKAIPGRDYNVVASKNGPQIINIFIQVYPKHFRKLGKRDFQEELAMAMGLEESQQLRITRGPAGTLCLEIPKPRSMWLKIQASKLPHRAGVVGLDTRGKSARIDFTDPEIAHVLLAGATRSGKTNSQRLLAWGQVYYRPHETQLVIIDIEKGRLKWNDFNNIPQLLHPVVEDDQEARGVLAWLITELDRRRQGASAPTRLFIIIDEIQSLIEAGGCIDALERLARVGGEYQIHLIVATQHPTIEALGKNTFRRNLTVRVISRVDDATAAAISTGQKNTGAEGLSGPGDSIVVQPKQMDRVLVPLLNSKEVDLLPRNEYVNYLPLDSLDVEHVMDVAPEPQPAQVEPHTMEQLAYALGSGDAVNRLQRRFGIGGGRATRLKNDADELREELRDLGYGICEEHEG